jgi:hypothetical protein
MQACFSTFLVSFLPILACYVTMQVSFVSFLVSFIPILTCFVTMQACFSTLHPYFIIFIGNLAITLTNVIQIPLGSILS